MDTHELLPTRTERLSFPSRNPTVMQRMRLIKDALAQNSSNSSREKTPATGPRGTPLWRIVSIASGSTLSGC